MRTKKNNGKFKFPSLDIKGDLVLDNLEIKEGFSDIIIKPKISQEVKEVITKKKKNKCKSNKLI